ncbi:uncharacterized protein [Clytia hemisphaerica]
MDGVGSAVKTAIKNTLAFNPTSCIKNTEELFDHLPILPKVIIGSYSEEDVDAFKALYPSNIDDLNIVAPSFGVSKIHEVHFPLDSMEAINWRMVSSDSFTAVKLLSTRTSTKKRQKKRDVSDNEDVEDVEDVEDSIDKDNDDESSKHDETDDEFEDEDEIENRFSAIKVKQSIGDEKNKGKFYCIYYDKGRYWARLIKGFRHDSQDEVCFQAEVLFLEYKSGYWEFPVKKKSEIVDTKYFFVGPCTPSETNKRGYQFIEDLKAVQLYKKIKSV